MNLSLILPPILFPTLFIVLGTLEIVFFSKHREANMGYKTKKSRISDRNWAFAQIFFGKIWLAMGVLFLIIALIPIAMYKTINQDMTSYFNIAFVVISIISSIIVERKLSFLDKE